MNNEGVEYLLKLAQVQGVACASVADGYVLVFDREHMKRIIEKHADSPTMVIFVKTASGENLQ